MSDLQSVCGAFATNVGDGSVVSMWDSDQCDILLGCDVDDYWSALGHRTKSLVPANIYI